jgi:hypothetical protein
VYLRAADVSSFCTLADGVIVQRIEVDPSVKTNLWSK